MEALFFTVVLVAMLFTTFFLVVHSKNKSIKELKSQLFSAKIDTEHANSTYLESVKIRRELRQRIADLNDKNTSLQKTIETLLNEKSSLEDMIHRMTFRPKKNGKFIKMNVEGSAK